MYIYFLFGVVINFILLCFYFSFGYWEFFNWLLGPFAMSSSLHFVCSQRFCFLFFVFSAPPYFLPLGETSDLLYLAPPQSWKQSFLQEVWFLLLEDSIRNQNLGTGYACCYRDVIASRPPQLKEIYVCTNLGIHMYRV